MTPSPASAWKPVDESAALWKPVDDQPDKSESQAPAPITVPGNTPVERRRYLQSHPEAAKLNREEGLKEFRGEPTEDSTGSRFIKGLVSPITGAASDVGQWFGDIGRGARTPDMNRMPGLQGAPFIPIGESQAGQVATGDIAGAVGSGIGQAGVVAGLAKGIGPKRLDAGEGAGGITDRLNALRAPAPITEAPSSWNGARGGNPNYPEIPGVAKFAMRRIPGGKLVTDAYDLWRSTHPNEAIDDRFGKFTPQPVAAKGPPPIGTPDKFGKFTAPSGLLPEPVPEASVPDKFGRFTPPKGMAPGPIGPPPDKFGQFTPQPKATQPPVIGPKPPAMPPNEPITGPPEIPISNKSPVSGETTTGGGPAGGIVLPELEGVPSRYTDLGKERMAIIAQNALRKDQTVAAYLRSKGITAEQFEKASSNPDQLRAWAKEAGYPRGMNRPQDILSMLKEGSQ